MQNYNGMNPIVNLMHLSMYKGKISFFLGGGGGGVCACIENPFQHLFLRNYKVMQ